MSAEVFKVIITGSTFLLQKACGIKRTKQENWLNSTSPANTLLSLQSIKFFVPFLSGKNKTEFREMQFCEEQNIKSSPVSSVSPCFPLPADTFMTEKTGSKTSSAGKKLYVPSSFSTLMDLIRASTSNHNFRLAYFLRSSKLLWSYSIKDKASWPCSQLGRQQWCVSNLLKSNIFETSTL